MLRVLHLPKELVALRILEDAQSREVIESAKLLRPLWSVVTNMPDRRTSATLLGKPSLTRR